MRHEQGGAHAAEGFARATGRPGVCLATSGPGATNLITGLADAMMDSTPVVALTAQVPTHLIGRDGFQEADIFGLTQPVTKHNWIVRDADDARADPPRRVPDRRLGAPRPGPRRRPPRLHAGRDRGPGRRAASRRTGSTGPTPPRSATPPSPSRTRGGRSSTSGGGVISSGASEEVRRLAKKARIPVTTTLMGKGAFPETDPQSLGMLGMHGTAYANHAMHECDLIIGVGRPVRRPRHAEARDVGAARPRGPRRHRRVGDRQEPEGRLPARRRRPDRPARRSSRSSARPTRPPGGRGSRS